MREIRVFSSHRAAHLADLDERAAMTREQRLALGAELHAFWVRNYYPDAIGLDRTVQVVRRTQR